MDIVDLEENLNCELKRDFIGMKDGFVEVGERKWFYPSKYRELAAEMKNFEVRPDDIWVTGYPRSGTTLTEDLVWLLSHNLDFDEAKVFRVKFFEMAPDSFGTIEAKIGPSYKDKMQRDIYFMMQFYHNTPLISFPTRRNQYFRLNMVLNEKNVQDIIMRFPQEADQIKKRKDTLNILKTYRSRRVIKTHLPFELLPSDILNKGCKIIYVCRFPKDVCVSYFHLQVENRNTQFSADFEKFWRYFQNGKSMFGPYFEHVKQGFERIGSRNFLFTFYEEFSKDNRAHINNLSQFLEIPLSETDLDKLEQYIQIDNFRNGRVTKMKDRNNEPINFIRRGKVGGWMDYFTEEMNNQADTWIEMNTTKIGIKFPQQHK